VTLDDPATSNQAILNAIGIFHGAFHPEYPFLRCTEGSVKEATPTPYHAEVSYRYEVPQVGTQDFEPDPLSRPPIWSFSSTTTTKPALNYYEGDGNSDIRPLTNTADDYFEGLTVESAEIRAVIAANKIAYPYADAAAVTNAINDAPYLGMPKHTWKCQGIGAQQRTEIVSVGGTDIEVKYWEVTVELLYRPETWILKLPNVGFNYYPGGTGDKAPVYVTDAAPNSATNGQDVPSQSPLSLTENGDIKTGEPDILERRPYPEVDFEFYFSLPTF
jgi:hypothetical protein